MIHVVPLKPAHCRLVAHDIRERDREELRVGWGSAPWETMSVGMADSTRALTVLNDLKPMCVAGVIPLEILTGRYALWIVGTNEIDRHPFAFARASRKWLPRLLDGCGIVTNLIDSLDKPALKWAQWLGFSFRPWQDNDRFVQFFGYGKGVSCRRVA